MISISLSLAAAATMVAFMQRQPILSEGQGTFARMVAKEFKHNLESGTALHESLLVEHEIQQRARWARIGRSLIKHQEVETLDIRMTPTGIHQAVKLISQLLPEEESPNAHS